MRQTTTAAIASPAATLDPEVVGFRSQFGATSPLDELVRTGAQRMLQTAIEAEVEEFVTLHRDRRDAIGRRQVVRNGYQPARELLTGAGRLEIQQPRVRDNSSEKEQRITFSSSILPPYLRRSKSIDELIPWLYLKGISTGDFSEALQSLLGADAPGLSPNVVVRLKEKWGQEYDQWSRRDLREKQYVYVWADGIHVNVRLENEANQRQCLLVLMGATATGLKELIAVVDGYRESEQSWYELLVDLKTRGLSLAPKLAIGDGALGFWAALRKVYGETREQRCWVHKTANVLNNMPKSVQPRAKADIHEIWMAETRAACHEGLRCLPGKVSRPSTRRPVNVWRRIATCCSPSTTSRPNIGCTCGRPTPSNRRSPPFGLRHRRTKGCGTGRLA